MWTEGRVSVVVVTHNKRRQLLHTLESLRSLPGRRPIIVIDNGSVDGTAAAIAEQFPSVLLIRARRNLGAAARNIGVAYVHTPYIAFCDDDMQWEAGALERAVAMLDASPDVAVLNACVQIGPTRSLSPACVAMAQSPLSRECLPGPQLLDFMAGACVMRTRAFYDVGGYWPPFFLGGEEALMALDMVERGWRIVYADDVVSRRFPARPASVRGDERLRIRNDIWVAWMRRPLRPAWRKTCEQLGNARLRGIFWRTLADAAIGLPRALRQRRVISPAVENMRALLDTVPADLSSSLVSVINPAQKHHSV
ncbi:glycosyltransferase [Pusillimonas sp. SM2304]|uniref:glycosyltransferase family 2 protein n=1 Tax=Pusillimonas sp. SM2304 TaxID=3073241 RepID=UPI0028742AA4|nr:glycosyltransferase [Pusillimonas sp. SM2304]MDS1139335.1 glycosyltransferase [Pusillimonas sp. SM2304]